MNQDEKEMISKVAAFCQVIDSSALHRYGLMEQILKTEFYQPEFDILRKEIGRCFVTASYQGCITLTNHLLERYCKLLLIYFESGIKTISDLQSIEERFEKVNKRYLDADLNDTLNKCRSHNLITKENRKELDQYRDKFRNGYSHANPKQILGEKKGRFVLGSLSNNKKSEVKELTYSNVPFLQGIAIAEFSKANALSYFIVVENLIRKTINYIQPEKDIIKYQLIRIVSDGVKEK